MKFESNLKETEVYWQLWMVYWQLWGLYWQLYRFYWQLSSK
ncbi:hypothetical protein [Viridibacillus soli]|nr:hypothetical protein [Viridibacillus soli]